MGEEHAILAPAPGPPRTSVRTRAEALRRGQEEIRRVGRELRAKGTI